MPVINISIPLLTHIACTDNKSKANKYWKINNQGLYNGAVNKFKRAIITGNMHNYMINSFPSLYDDLKIKKTRSIEYIFYTVENHGDISMRSGKLCWKPVKTGYQSDWDLNNISDIWIKTGNDALVLSGILTDDNTGVINKTTYSHVIVDNLDELELEIIIKY